MCSSFIRVAHQEHVYSPGAPSSPHTAFGDGLTKATTGIKASFIIKLVDDNGEMIQQPWADGNSLFVYVWIANADQVCHHNRTISPSDDVCAP